MRRLVLDTNVVLSGLLWSGPPHHLLMFAERNAAVQLFSSQALLDELADVLTRASITKRLNLIHKNASDVMVDYLHAATVLVPQPLRQPVCRDPDDDSVLALAVSAQADTIISGDNDLLVLQSFEGIPIITALEALRWLEVAN